MLKNMQIKKKLISTFILISLLSSIGGVMGFLEMNNMNSSYSKALTSYGFAQGDIGRFTTEMNNVRVLLRNIIIDTEPEQIKADGEEITKSFEKLNKYLAVVEKSVDSSNQDDFDKIKANMVNFENFANQEVTLASQNKNSEAYATLKQATPLINEIRACAETMLADKTAAGNQIAQELSTQAKMADIIILAVVFVSIVISLLIAFIIAKGISKPAAEMAYAAQRMAEGDLSVQINIDSNDEIGQLAKAFAQSNHMMRAYINDIKKNLATMAQGNLNIKLTEDFKGDFVELKHSMENIAEALNDALTQINEASDQVSTGSSQVSDGSQALAQGATEQASTVEELSASIIEISAQIKDNANHAVEASENVHQVSDEIEVSNKHMKEMVEAMAQINDSSSQIGKIIKTIEDIAFQTNILALNAAVEAARAGTAGKGFAVVADEVRSLATKSAEAAKDTTDLIENSMQQVQNGSRIADETAKSLLRVVEKAKLVSDIVENISDASNRQSHAISEVTQGVEQISSVVQTNAATAEESAATSEELSGQSSLLKELVGQFTLVR